MVIQTQNKNIKQTTEGTTGGDTTTATINAEEYHRSDNTLRSWDKPSSYNYKMGSASLPK